MTRNPINGGTDVVSDDTSDAGDGVATAAVVTGLAQMSTATILTMAVLVATALWGGRAGVWWCSSSCNDDDDGQNIAQFQIFPQPLKIK